MGLDDAHAVNNTTISSVNVMSPAPRQAIIWNNAELFLVRTLGTYFNETWIKGIIVIRENEFTIVVCKITAILPRPQCDE